MKDKISLRFRHPYAVCLGSCPNFEIRVSPSGDVETLALPLKENGKPRSIVRFRVAPAAVAGFQRIAVVALSDGQVAPETACAPILDQDGKIDSLGDPRPDDIELVFERQGHVERMTACSDNWPLRARLQDALRALGVDSQFGRKLKD